MPGSQVSPTPISSGGGGSGLSAAYGSGLFGDGADGNLTLAAPFNLNKEFFYNNLTITATGIIKNSGFRCYVKGTLTIDAGGSLNMDGNSASGGTAGLAIAASQTLGGGGGVGGTGVVGSNGNFGGGSGGNSSVNALLQSPIGGNGGDAVNTGGLGGGATSPPQGQRWGSGAWLQQGRFNNGTASGLWNGGGGGGAGAGFAAPNVSGGGGGGGSIAWIAARNITNNGRISANGGNGGNAGAGASFASGGGGGAGGLVLVATLSQVTGVVTATGGTGGAGFGSGSLPGAAGRDGTVSIVVLS